MSNVPENVLVEKKRGLIHGFPQPMTRLPHVVLCLAALWFIVRPAAAQEKQYALSNFDVTVQVRPDGSYEVEESITYDFQRGAFSRAYRSVVGDGGAIRAVRVTSPDTPVDSVRIGEANGTPQVRWAFPDRSAPAQFDVRYVLEEAIYERGGRNVVELDVMADEAVVPTRDVDVRVLLPTAFDLQRNQVALDPAGAGTVQREAGRLVATFHRDRVAAGDDFEVEVSFPTQIAGEFIPTGAQILFGVLLVLLGGGAGGIAAWRWRGPRPEVTARRPPSDLDLPTAVALLGKHDGQAFLAVLFDLARRGHVTLRHDQEAHMLGSSDVVRLDVHPDAADLTDFEQRFVDILRDHDTLDDFWENTSSFRSDEMSDQRTELYDRGWMRSHTLRSTLLLIVAIVAAIGGFVAIASGEGALPFYLLFAGMGISLGGFIAATRRYTWTQDGARRAMALRSYLDHEKAEVERLRETDPARAAERLVDALPWLLLHDEVAKSWIEETKEALDAAEATPELPDGFVSLVADRDDTGAAVAAFLPVVAVMGTVESSAAGAAGGAGAAAGGAAAGGGAGAAGAS